MMHSVIVTGASSFVGCHLARAFADAGHAVTATHSRPIAGYQGIQAARMTWVEEKARLAQLDVTDGNAVQRLAQTTAPDLWVHHAGHAVDYGSPTYDRARGDAVNVAPLESIFAVMGETGGGILITGSNAEYADGDQAARETDNGRPALPYGQSKLAKTARARELSARYGVAARVGRLFIPFGKFDNPAKLLASAQIALTEGRPIDLSPCDQKRDFLGVTDVCSAWMKMADDLSRGGFEVFNICSGAATELKVLLLALAEALNADTALLKFGARPMRPGEPAVSFGDNSKARKVLDWSPRPLDRAIREDLLA